MTTKETARLARSERHYLMKVAPGCYVDASAEDSCLARYINDSRRAATQTCWFDKQAGTEAHDPRALVRALRDIEPGEELFSPYGKWYWIGFDDAKRREAGPAASVASSGEPIREA